LTRRRSLCHTARLRRRWRAAAEQAVTRRSRLQTHTRAQDWVQGCRQNGWKVV